MALDLIVGPANAGKVAELYERFRACLDGGGSALFVVPNAAAIRRAERELLDRGSVIGGAVTTFDGVVGRVAERAGLRRPLLPTARRRVELARLVAATPLAAIGPSAEGARFADALGRLFDRLGSALVDPDQLAAASEDDATAGDLALLYRAWWLRLDELGLSDAACQRVAACRALERSLGAWDDTALFVEGFEDLTLAQETVVRLIGERSGATISLPYEPGRVAFAALRASVGRLAEGARIEERPPISGIRPPRLARLERRLFEPGEAGEVVDGGDETLAAFEAAGARAEADLVLVEVCRALREGVPAERIAVITPRDPSAYGELHTALVLGGVPHVLDRATTFGRTPFGFALERLLAAAWDQTPERAALFAWLRSPWSGIARRRVDFVEGRLRGRAITAADAVEAAIVEAIGRPLDALARLRTPGDPAERVAEEVRRMIVAAHGLSARPPTPEGAAELAAARAAREALAGLAGLDPPATRDEVRAAVDRARVDERRHRAGRLLVCDPGAARGLDVDVAIVLGLDQSGFGGSRRDDAFLPDGVRERLGDGLAPDDPGDLDRHLLYVALTRGARRVVVGRRIAGDDGRPLESSPFWREVERAAGGLGTVARRGLADVAFRVEDAPTVRERVRAVVALAQDDAHRASRIAEADGTGRRLVRARRAWRRETRLRDPRVLAHMKALDRFNVTSLERFGDCSSWWFIERHLGPREIDAAYDPRLQGQVAHTALQRFYRQAPAAFGSDRLRPEDADGAAALMRDLVHEAMAGQTLPSDTLAARIIERRVARDLARFVRAESARPSPLAPTRLEVSFGGASAAPGLKEGLRIDDFAVTGKIDRIDTDPAFTAHALVQDYKTGRTAWSASRLIPQGRLQIPLYVLAARELLGLEPIGGLYRALGPGGETRGVVDRAATEVLPTGVFATDLVDAEQLWSIVEGARRLAAAHVTRIRRGDVRHDPRDGTCPSYCPWGEACRIPR